jgi:hypothetical protein
MLSIISFFVLLNLQKLILNWVICGLPDMLE